MPVSDTVIILIVVKICGRVSMSRLHKVVYILKDSVQISIFAHLPVLAA
jgi:hypothetical protein